MSKIGNRGDAFGVFAEIALRVHEDMGELTEVLHLIAASANELVGTDIAWLVLTDADNEVLRPVVLVGFRSARFLEVSLPLAYGVGGQALARRAPVAVEDYRIYDDPVHPTSTEVRAVIEEEGIRSLVCCPLIRGADPVGALYVARRRRSTFGEDDVRLLEALAGQAAVAIENKRLYARLREQHELLERSNDIHDRFTEASFRGVGLAGIAEALAALIGCTVRITPVGDALQTVTAPRGAQDPTSSSREPITAGNQVLGNIEVLHHGPLSPLDAKAIEHARTVCGFELVKFRYAAEVERRFRSRLLDDLIDSTHADDQDLTERARHLGFDLVRATRVIVIAQTAPGARQPLLDDVLDVIRSHGGHGSTPLVTERSGRVILAVPNDLDHRVDQIVDQLRTRTSRSNASGGIGVGPHLVDVHASYLAADACASFAARSDHDDGALRVVRYDTLGPLNFVLDAPNVDFTVQAVRRRLGPLLEHDDTHRMQLVPTLRAYLDAGGHHGDTCAQLFIGVTTLKYRLDKISALLQVDLRDPSVRFDLHLAVTLLEFLGERHPTAAAERGS